MTKSNVKKSPAASDSAFRNEGNNGAKGQAKRYLSRNSGLKAGLSPRKAAPSPLGHRILNAKPGSASASRTVRDRLERILDELDGEALVRVLDAAMAARSAMSLAALGRVENPEDHVPESQDGSSMRIERSDDGGTYHLIAGKVWKMLAAEEIASLLRIARHVESETAASRHLYLWLDRERKDIATDLEITAASSKRLPAILRLLKETFPVKSPRRLP